jgi:hypothetical protein
LFYQPCVEIGSICIAFVSAQNSNEIFLKITTFDYAIFSTHKIKKSQQEYHFLFVRNKVAHCFSVGLMPSVSTTTTFK